MYYISIWFKMHDWISLEKDLSATVERTIGRVDDIVKEITFPIGSPVKLRMTIGRGDLLKGLSIGQTKLYVLYHYMV